MAVKRKNNSKENLAWKINLLAAKAGEETYIEQAKKAALSQKPDQEEQQQIQEELAKAKRKKLETKLFHTRKEARTCLKKSKVMETQKQIKKLREAQKYVTSADEIKDDETNAIKKKGKVYTTKDIERFEKELEIIKTIDLELLADKSLTKYIQKNTTLKNDEMLSALLPTMIPSVTEKVSMNDKEKSEISNVEARLLGNKLVTDSLRKTISEIEMLLLGAEQRKLIKDTQRKAQKQQQHEQDHRQIASSKRQPTSERTYTSSSLFVDSLGANDDNDDSGQPQKETPVKRKTPTDWEDPDFEKYYNGAPEKQNRPGQRQRRMKWEALHGDKAKHIVSGNLPVNELRKQKQKNKHKDDGRKGTNDQSQRPSFGNNNRHAVSATEKKEENPEEFHPSWQAKRQQQEMMAKALSGQGGGNKKIVFGDDTE